MKQLIEDIYNTNRYLLGEGYDNALEYLKHLIDLEVTEVESGTEIGSWTVPDEWVIRDAHLKIGDEKIVDYKDDPLSLMVGSHPVNEKVGSEEILKHLYIHRKPEGADTIELSTCVDCNIEDIEERARQVRPYEYHFYGDPNWGFCLTKEEWEENEEKFRDKRRKFEVFVDSEFRPGKLKIATHTIPGKTDREILLLAHLDHPYQANDNLSGVATLVEVAKKVRGMDLDHTAKIVFCPETIGSIAYIHTHDISNVEFVLALDCVGGKNTVLIQRSFDVGDKVNMAVHLAVKGLGIDHRLGEFRLLIGSDEYAFNDPERGIPGVMISRYPYPEYHSSLDTPEIITEESLEEVRDLVLKAIEIYEKDFIPKRKFVGPLFREKYDVQTQSKQFNRNMDYFLYLMDGEKSLIELCYITGIGFDFAYKLVTKLKDEGLVVDSGKRG